MTCCGTPAPCWQGKAVAGVVNAGDREHREVVTTNRRADGGKRAHGQAKAWAQRGPGRRAISRRAPVSSSVSARALN